SFIWQSPKDILRRSLACLWVGGERSSSDTILESPTSRSCLDGSTWRCAQRVSPRLSVKSPRCARSQARLPGVSKLFIGPRGADHQNSSAVRLWDHRERAKEYPWRHLRPSYPQSRKLRSRSCRRPL